MKHGKITSLILALCLLAALMGMSAAATASDNLLTDGSFEEWGTTGILQGWELLNQKPSNATVTPADNVKADGNYSAKIEAVGTQGRVAFYQNIGRLSLGATYKASVKLNATSLSGTGARLMVRFGSNGGSPYWGPSAKVDAATDGWQELTVQGTVNAETAEMDAFVVLDIISGSADYTIYVDDCKAEKVMATISNGGFEDGGTGWTFGGGTPAATAANNIITEDGNSYAEFTVKGQKVTRTISGLIPGTKYRISFDICSNGSYIYVDYNNSILGSILNNYSTEGEWERQYMAWTQPESETTRGFRFMFNATPADGAYARIDNVVLEEIDDNNLIYNGDFEYGKNGLGRKNYGEWGTNTYATYTQVEGGIGGTHAMQLTREDQQAGYGMLSQNFTVETGLYEFAVYVKNISLTNNDSGVGIALRTKEKNTNFSADTLPQGKWTRVRVITNDTLTSALAEFRVHGYGTVLVDNFSYRKLDAPIITYAKSDGEYCENLVNGVKVSVAMPAAQVGDIAMLAIYSRNDNATSLAGLTLQAVTSSDVTNGFAEFTLAADMLEDFDDVNYYAKTLIFKGGTLEPIQSAVILTK